VTSAAATQRERERLLAVYCVARDSSRVDGLDAGQRARLEREHRRALDAVVRAKVGLVKSVADHVMRHRRRGVEYDDAIAYGFEGLLVALRKYDPSRGCSLSTMAVWWIRQNISRHLDDEGSTIRVPVHARGTHRRLARKRAELTAELSRPPTAAELANAAGVPVAAVAKDAAIPWASPLSLDAPASPDAGSGTLGDVIADDAEGPEDAADRLDRERIAKRLVRAAGLDPRDAAVLWARLEGRTLRNVSVEMGCARERIRQREARAMRLVAMVARINRHASP